MHVVRVEKHYRAAELADADFERHPRARGGLRENHRPRLPVKRLGFAITALGLDGFCRGEDFFHRFPRHALEFQ